MPQSSTPTSTRHAPFKVVLITGPSGAGRSTSIHALEDFGFEAIDNLPLTLLPRLLSGPPMTRNLALGIDVRNRDFSAETVIEAVDIIDNETIFDCSLVYLDCATEVLIRRYSETRRRHPLAPDETPEEGIRRELDLLGGLKQRADLLIDTTDMSPHDLKSELQDWFGAKSSQKMAVSLQSFSYKRGMPRGLDMVLDCRMLRNPHWDEALRALDGRDSRVAEYIADDPLFSDFFNKTLDLVELLLPAYRAEGKSYFTLAFGCTGGQHRSVFMAEALANALAERGWQVSIRHRELEREHERKL
ncbi:MAG: RNase adapter RapZ [Alphaproteobacteria bacterium]|nr:RNase adapter RapZ [Alphaproteobacteria bacterium]